MATVAERAALLMEHLVTHDGYPGHGYSQYSRNGDGTIEVVRVDGQDFQVAGGDRDCSSAVISCYSAQGVDVGGATYTGNMRRCMTGTGNFKWVPRPTSYSAQPGDIYLNESHHAAMCISPYGSARGDLLAQFSISEKGTVDGREGDQTGRESNIKAFYDYPWDGDLVYCGPGSVQAPQAPAASGAPNLGDLNWFGPKFAREWQTQLGTIVDGVVSGQYSGNRKYFWATDGGVTYENDGWGSVIRELQSRLISRGYSCGSSGVDGHYGRDTIAAHQRWLSDRGFSVGSCGADGYHGTATNYAMGRALQAGAYREL